MLVYTFNSHFDFLNSELFILRLKGVIVCDYLLLLRV